MIVDNRQDYPKKPYLHIILYVTFFRMSPDLFLILLFDNELSYEF